MGIENAFEKIVAMEDTPYHKPDPRSFDAILESLKEKNIPKERSIYVGDTKVDIEAGQGAGIRTLMVETGLYMTTHIKTHPIPENDILPSLAFLPAWLEKTRDY